jgi:hypothetical protein
VKVSRQQFDSSLQLLESKYSKVADFLSTEYNEGENLLISLESRPKLIMIESGPIAGALAAI